MNKTFKEVLSLTLGLAVLGGSSTISAHAASWHKGTPKAIQGKWRTAGYEGKYHQRTTVHIGKKTVDSYTTDQNGIGDMTWPMVTNKAEYKYLGHHAYQIKGLFFNQTHENFKAQLHGHTRLTIRSFRLTTRSLHLYRY